MAGSLSGYRIVDATTMVTGPWSTSILGDQGADVVKKEKTIAFAQLRFRLIELTVGLRACCYVRSFHRFGSRLLCMTATTTSVLLDTR